MSYTIRPASRADTVPLIGLYGESGSGKTMSALVLARGLVGPKGKIVLIDTESGRGDLYADVIPGGYDVLPLGEPFTPSRYAEALKVAWKDAAAVIVDSASHEWEGAGGVLDMAAANEANSGKPGLHNWKRPKMLHTAFMLAALQSPCPLIFCLRAKYKSRQIKNARGKTEIVKDDHTTPMQSGDFIFEMTVHGEMSSQPDKHGEFKGGYFRMTKCSHPDLEKVFRTDQQLSVATGEALAKWCRRGEETSPPSTPSSPATSASTPASTPASSSPPPQTVRLAAFRAADEGTAAFRAWWKDQSPEDRATLKPDMNALKRAAAVADEAAQEPADEMFT
jgi:hypothetical protein